MENKETLPGRRKEDLGYLDQKKTILSWALYDWGNSAFATTVMAGFFPAFLNDYWALGTGIDPTVPLGIGNSIASIILAILAPFLGAMADKMAGKKKFVTIFALMGISMTACLALIGQGLLMPAIILYIFGTIGFSGANIFYDGILPGVASEKKIDYVSSLGFALGYIGGGILFVINIMMFLFMPDSAVAIKLSFVSVAIWWAVFSIPLLVNVKEPKAEVKVSARKAANLGWAQLKDTFKDIKNLKVVGIFLLGYWFYIDGVDTIIKMAVDYGKDVLSGSATDDEVTTYLMIALLITQFVAFPGTLLFSKFAQKIGVKKGILVAIGAYALITVLGYFMSELWHFMALAVMIGCFQGGIQALSRSLFSRIIPVEKSGQFYGFFNMLGKFAAVIGPLLMAMVVQITGSTQLSILSIIFLFIIGGLIFSRVDVAEGERMAREYLTDIPEEKQAEDLDEVEPTI